MTRHYQWNKRDTNYGIVRADELAGIAANKAIYDCNQNWIPPIEKAKLIKNIMATLYYTDKWSKYEQLQSNHYLAANIWLWKDHIYTHYDSKEEQEHLTAIQIQILFKMAILMRSGYLRTNFVQHVLLHLNHYSQQSLNPTNIIPILQCNTCCNIINSGLCNNCNELETIEHYLLYCTNNVQLRMLMLQDIIPIYNQQQIPINMCNLLFVPNTIANNKKRRWIYRRLIYHAICKYVMQTSRWNFFK
eukprot:302204_1